MNEISHSVPNESPEAIASRLMNKAEYRDGLHEIAIGLLILTFVGLNLLPEVFKGSFGSMASFWGTLLLMPTLGFGSNCVIKKVRRRFLIGKVGYVKLKQVNRKGRGIRLGIIVGVAFVTAALVTFIVFKGVTATHKGGDAANWGLFPLTGWLHAGTGIYLGAIMIFLARLPRYVIGGVIMVAMGILLAFNRASLTAGFTILYGFAGLLCLVSGCVVFLLLLRQPAEPEE